MKQIKILIYLILFKCTFMSYTLAQYDFCTLDTIDSESNICEPSNNLYVSESENDCRMVGSKCWCILIDNRNMVYHGNMVIELVQTFNSVNSRPEQNKFDEIKSYLQFEIISGLNRFIVQPPTASTIINSIKIPNNETCKLSNTKRVQSLDFHPPTSDDVQFTATNNYKDLNGAYPNFYDCLLRSNYTDNSIKYCPNYRPEFMIEKRSSLHDQTYWCINIKNSNYKLTSENRLHIDYSSPNRWFVFFPLDAYTQREDTGKDFHLGNQRTTIAISENNNELVDLESITIDNQPICSYFGPTIATDGSDVRVSPQEDLRIVKDYPTFFPEVEQQNDSNPASSIKKCGVKSTNRNSLISFGLDTKPGDWPWHAAIYKNRVKSNPEFICGGTLIDERTIVTAAHCVVELNKIIPPGRLTAELGRHNLRFASAETQDYRVFDVIPHIAYNPGTFENDIAILVLATYVKLSQFINFVCLPQPNFNLEGITGATVGWGLDHDNQFQNELKVANFPVVEKIQCLESNRGFFSKFLMNTNFCAGYKNNTNVCRGDSGGGFVFNTNGNWFLGGVTSIGVSLKSLEHDCDLSQYGIFTDVTKYVTWIKENS